uniref:phage tail tape measure protein n=1 Tax=Aerococcus urinaeequi TaxID=51665 RepID=UPI00352A2433
VIPTLQRKSEEFATSIANMSDSSRKKIVEFAGALAVGGPLLIAISATINAVRNLSSVVMAAFALPGAPWVLAAAAIAAVTYELYKFSKAQEQITGRTSAEVLDRSKYMKQAGEIFAERHGKYPITAQEYQELDKIIDELMSKERKAKIEITPTVTAPKKSPTTAGAAIDLSKLLGTEGEKATDEASKAVKAITDQVEYMGMSYETAIASLEKMKASLTPLSDAWKLATDTIKKYREELANSTQDQARLAGASAAAEIKRIEQTKQMQLEAQEAAAQGVVKFWQEVDWEYNQGLIDAQSYFDMLKGELERVTQGSEEWKRTFEDIQRVALDIVNTNIDTLSEQLEAGKITTEEFNTYVAELKGQFQDLPLVVNQIDDALKNAKSTTEDLTLQTQLWARDLSKGLADAIVYGRSLSDVLNNILRQIASSMLQKLIFGWLPFEKGGVINKGKLQPFASGGIVASPTIFPMAGGAGLMGEAGPEAIMPLKRTSSGDLGVKAEGAGVTNITMNINAVDANSFVQMLRHNKAAITSLVVENILSDGQIRRTIKGVT